MHAILMFLYKHFYILSGGILKSLVLNLLCETVSLYPDEIHKTTNHVHDAISVQLESRGLKTGGTYNEYMYQ